MTLKGLKRRVAFFIVNRFLSGTRPQFWSLKRSLLNWAGMKIGKRTKIVGPVRLYGDLVVGEDTWIGTGITIHGNGRVRIGSNCDLGPEVTFLTGSHEVGSWSRRAGNGLRFEIEIHNGTWIGARSTITGNTIIGRGCVVGSCAFVNKSFGDNVMLAGIPALVKKELE